MSHAMSAVIEQSVDFSPLGGQTSSSVSGSLDFGFTGHFFPKIGNHVLAPFRGYSAELGRWLNRDPIGYHDGHNLFSYAGNEPIRHIDLLGLERYITGLHPVVTVPSPESPTGYVSYEFGPRSWFCAFTGVCKGQVKIYPAFKPDNPDEIIPSSPEDDKDLIKLIYELQEHPPYYSPFLNNCRNFVDFTAHGANQSGYPILGY